MQNFVGGLSSRVKRGRLVEISFNKPTVAPKNPYNTMNTYHFVVLAL